MSKYLGDVSAYAYAVSKGYTGSEEEFAELMASYAEVAIQAAESARQAAQSATTAGQAASSASGSATTANTKAEEAASSAQTASTKASEAAESVERAARSATTASNASETAATKANEASQSATDAASSATTANTAKNDAVTAKDSAVEAKEAAETAKTNAETAAASVSASAAKIAYLQDWAGAISRNAVDNATVMYKQATETVSQYEKLNGVISWSYNKPSGYVYVGEIIGSKAEVTGKKYELRIENTGENNALLNVILSGGASWAPQNHHLTLVDGHVLVPNEVWNCAIDMSVYADKMADFASDRNIYLLVASLSSQDVNANVQMKLAVYPVIEEEHVPMAFVPLSENAKYAQKAEFAENAGFVYLDDAELPVIGVTGTASEGGLTWSQEGNKHVLTIEEGTTGTGQIYGRIAWDIKSLFGKGYKLRFTITNQLGNRASYTFNNWFLSRASTSWGASTIKTIALGDIGGNYLLPRSEFELDIDTYFSDVDPNNYTNMYLLIGAFQYNPSNKAANVLTIEVKAYSADNYVIADELKGFDKDDYYTKEEVDDLIGTRTLDTDLLVWGDSLTAGAGGNGTSYPAVCANELGLTYKNCGVGGENANTIAARQGGNELIIPAGEINGTYPYTDFVDPFGGNVRPLRQGTGSNSGNKIYIDGEECTLSITQTSSTSTDAVYTISGYTGGASTVPKLARFAGSNFNGKIVVIWVGTNGASVTGTTSAVEARIAIIDSMIKHLDHNRYVIMGISRGTETNQAADDAAMLAHYGNKFFPTRKLLVDYGLTINGLTPTEQDTADIAVGTVPTQLRSDTTHMNAYGYTAIGKMLADKIRSLGYID